MHFSHHPALWAQYPELACGVLSARGLHRNVDAEPAIARFEARARERLALAGSESELAQIQAWRRAFQRMGLKPTQYRCAAESLLRRLRKEDALPRIHPLIDLCNAISTAYAIPVAVLDLQRVTGDLQVRHAEGTESYLSFGGETEHPDAGEVTFVDDTGQSHARRWTHRQSGLSAMRDETSDVLIVAEAMHPGGADDVAKLVAETAQCLREIWGVEARTQLLSAADPRFAVDQHFSSR